MFPLLPSTRLPSPHPGIRRWFEGTQMATPLWPHCDATCLLSHLALGSALLHKSFPSQGASSVSHITTAPHWLLIPFMLSTLNPGVGTRVPMTLLPLLQQVPSVPPSGLLRNPVTGWWISAFHIHFSLSRFFFFLSGAKTFKLKTSLAHSPHAWVPPKIPPQRTARLANSRAGNYTAAITATEF